MIVELPTDKKILDLNNYNAIFNSEIGGALRWIMRRHKMTVKQLQSRIKGVSNSAWRSYTQMSYQQNRPLHVIAAFSWLTQISMLAIFKGNNIKHNWPRMCNETITGIILAGVLLEEQFEMMVNLILETLNKRRDIQTISIIKLLLKKLPHKNNNFLMPEELDIDDFKEDYYQSIANQLRLFREKNGISMSLMGRVLNIPVNRLYTYEDLNNPVSIPTYVAVRLKLGFDLDQTILFLSGMKRYHNFYLLREVQQIR